MLMSLRFLTAHFAVSPQINVDDLPAFKEQGFTAIISTRPDGEEKDQPRVADLGVAAEKSGLAFAISRCAWAPRPTRIA